YDPLNRISTARSGATVDVRFTNDSCSACGGNPQGGGDRNLFVSSIAVGSTTVQPGDPSVSYTIAGCNRTENNVGIIACSGDMVTTVPDSGQSVAIAAYG